MSLLVITKTGPIELPINVEFTTDRQNNLILKNAQNANIAAMFNHDQWLYLIDGDLVIKNTPTQNE